MGQAAVVIGGISVRLRAARGVEWAYPRTHAQFLRNGGPADCTVHLEPLATAGPRRESGRASRRALVDRSQTPRDTLRVNEWDEDGHVAATLEHRLGSPVARLRFRPTQARNGYPLKEPFEHLLWMSLLASRRGLLVHASSAIVGDRAFVFAGNPRAGKSTMASLLKRGGAATVLSDELTIVRRVCGEPWAFGTPWHSSAKCMSLFGAPIAGLLFLEHGPRNVLFELSGGSAAARLYGCMYRPVWLGEAKVVGLLTGALLPATAYAARFAFVPDSSAVRYLQAELRWPDRAPA